MKRALAWVILNSEALFIFGLAGSILLGVGAVMSHILWVDPSQFLQILMLTGWSILFTAVFALTMFALAVFSRWLGIKLDQQFSRVVAWARETRSDE